MSCNNSTNGDPPFRYCGYGFGFQPIKESDLEPIHPPKHFEDELVPTDEELLNYYLIVVSLYLHENEASSSDEAIIYGLKQVLKQWGNK